MANTPGSNLGGGTEDTDRDTNTDTGVDYDTGDGNNGGGGGSGLTALTGYVDEIVDFFEAPGEAIRRYLVGIVIGAIAWVTTPVIDSVVFIFGGSQPNEFAAPGETWGLADLPVGIAGIVGDALSIPVSSAFTVLTGLIDSVAGPSPSPVNGIVLNLTIIAIVVALYRYGPLVLRAGLEAIPVIGGPLATLLGGAD